MEQLIKYCKRIEFKDKTKKPILGVITEENLQWIFFKTKFKKYRFSADSISLIEDTDIPFMEEEWRPIKNEE